MSTHEPIIRNETVEPGSDRSFGLIVGGVLLAIGAYQWIVGSMLFPWFTAIGGALAVLGLATPAVLHPANVAWTRLGLLLGRIVTPVVMFLIYIASVVPVGLALRLFGKDLLRLRSQADSPSYWIQRDPPGPPPESLKDQF